VPDFEHSADHQIIETASLLLVTTAAFASPEPR